MTDCDSSTPPYPFFPGGSLAIVLCLSSPSVPFTPGLVQKDSPNQPAEQPTNQSVFLIRFLGAKLEPSRHKWREVEPKKYPKEESES